MVIKEYHSLNNGDMLLHIAHLLWWIQSPLAVAEWWRVDVVKAYIPTFSYVFSLSHFSFEYIYGRVELDNELDSTLIL